ncbi:unnamed protein product [Dicrocoelium dendriticum]|nr:unnamed protein product [Dicrocoelium dendriticum]
MHTSGQNANAMLLFFGCRNTREFIYSSEIESARDAGIIQLYLALSREPGVKKTYVQDLLLLRSIEVWRLIDAQHAHVYVCGSPAMVRDVQICFIKVISIQDDKSTDWAERYMDRLRAEGRYHLDVWN